ncbi:hypothetical protein [Cupriavidus basilensis]|uniref:hypothetical protein n=1 Tax=Cupriavidus basilensis TaxID=68895 RepID=UPI0020A6AC04|nr:hypothetical protein [Cupriavidus basilensis]MCP3024736.1 hypothetical protein [Cupriavidus basilensis]
MAERYTDQQRQIVREILQAAMRLLRDDVPLEKVKAFFGESWKISPLSGNAFAKEYRFEHPALRNTDMRLYVESDPEDFREDRSKVAQVPTYFEIHFTPLLDKLAVEELEGLLQLKVGSYRFSDSHVVPYNRFLPDPLTPFAEPYRFQALEVPGSKFPVDVELDYIRPGAQPPEQGGLTSTVLAEIRIKRDYPVLTQEERKTRAREMPVSLRQRYGPLPMSGDMCHASGRYVPIFPDGRHYTHRFTGSSVFHLSADMRFPNAPVWNSQTGQDEWHEVWWQQVG